MNKNILLTHIPKTGGVSLNYLLTANPNIKYKHCFHVPLKFVIDDYKDYYKIAVVRDPVERVISGYYYIKSVQKNDKEQNKKQAKLIYKYYPDLLCEAKKKMIKEELEKEELEKEELENNSVSEIVNDKDNNKSENKNVKIPKLPITFRIKIFIYQKMHAKKIKLIKRIKEIENYDIVEFLENFEEYFNLINNNFKIKKDKKHQVSFAVFRPQYLFICDSDDKILSDKIYNIKNFYDELKKEGYIIADNIHNNVSNKTDKIEIKEEIKKKIRNIYKKDYEILSEFF